MTNYVHVHDEPDSRNWSSAVQFLTTEIFPDYKIRGRKRRKKRRRQQMRDEEAGGWIQETEGKRLD